MRVQSIYSIDGWINRRDAARCRKPQLAVRRSACRTLNIRNAVLGAFQSVGEAIHGDRHVAPFLRGVGLEIALARLDDPLPAIQPQVPVGVLEALEHDLAEE